MEDFRKKDLPFNSVSGFEPQKRVKTPADIPKWLQSQAFYNLMGFVNGISTAIQGKRITDSTIYISPTIQKLMAVFDKLHGFVDTTPPTDQPQRFGNKSYRVWARKMNHDIFILLKEALPQEKCQLFSELGFYLSESFGNSVRIDYGTGHELSFIFFMCALFKAEILTNEDIVAAALLLFHKYLLLVRRLQTTYRMEPAGSQGVWSLDDFQFVPFIWGSAQFCVNPPFDPPRFLDEQIIADYKDDYMFISCVDYIMKVKTGHFAEHSNQLWSISAVPSWIKINSGLVKMYQKEILSKFPIIQHVQFGKLMPFDSVMPGTTISPARLGFVPPAAPRSRSSETSSTKDMPPPSEKASKEEVESTKATASDDDKSAKTENQIESDVVSQM